MTSRRVRLTVPCSTSNLGAGFDCVGLALDRTLRASYAPSSTPLQVTRGGTLASLGDAEDLLLRVLRGRLQVRGVLEPTGSLRVDSDIPVGRGLGSSGAAVAAGLLLADALADDAEPHADSLVDAGVAAEGHPDNVAPCLLGGLVAAARGATGETRLMRAPLSEQIGFAFAAPGAAISTEAARAALPASVPHAVAVRALGRVAALLEGLARADASLLRIAFEDELHVPYRLPMIPGGAAAREAGVGAGAWAVTISGAGSGLIAVCDPEHASRVAAAMAEAFAREAGIEGVIGMQMRPAFAGARVEFE